MMEFITVPTNHPDLLILVKKLDEFFKRQWGQDIADGYQHLHQLSKMFYAVICYDQTIPIGCGCLKRIDHTTVEIKRMYVEPHYRRQKVATHILACLEKHAQSLGYQVSILETGKDMKDNILLYQKCGYLIVDNYGEFVNDQICICMKKQLSNR